MTFNADNNLLGNDGRGKKLRKGQNDLCDRSLTFLCSFFKRHNCDALCVQELGIRCDDVPPLVKAAFAKVGGVVYAHGTDDIGDGGSTGVMIVVRVGWTVTRVDKHVSGRAIHVTMEKGATKLGAVCAYMPSGLDAAPRTYGRAVAPKAFLRRVLAGDIYDWIREFTDRSPFSLVAGDLNETRCALDRMLVSQGSRVAKTR